MKDHFMGLQRCRPATAWCVGLAAVNQRGQPTVTLLGLIAFLIAALDIASSLVGLPFSSAGWSPLVFILIGVLLFALESLQPTGQRGA
jgi:hypothetical protein